MTGIDDGTWGQRMCRRAGSHLVIKTVAITVSITAFMVAYFYLLNHPVFPVHVMPLTIVDSWIPFTPWGFYPYVSLWFYLVTVPTLVATRDEGLEYGLSAFVLAVMGMAVYILFPTAVPAAHIDWSHWPLLADLKATDAAGNAFPSLHVAYSVFTLVWLDRYLRRIAAPWPWRVASLAWCLLIVWSTVAIRQHVTLDVAGGIVASVLALWITPRLTHLWKPST